MTHQGGVPIPVAVFDSNDNQVDSFGGGSGGGGAVTLAAGSVAAGSIVAGALVDGADLTQGTTTGAAVTTDAAGTLQQYLRGLVKMAATAGSFLVRGSVASGGIASGAIASGAVASGAIASGAVAAGALAAGAGVDGWDLGIGTTTDAAVAAGATGSVSAKLRRLSADIGSLLTDVQGKADPTENQLSHGEASSVTLTLTVTNGAYTIGDVVGGLLTFTTAVRANGGKAVVNSLKLSGVTAIAYELWLLNADLASAAQADADPLTYAAADGLKLLGVIPISTADYNAPGSGSFNVATVRGIGLQVEAGAATTSIYGYLKATATTSPGTTTIYLTLDTEYIS